MQKKIILFCIPYAGGLTSVFYKWKPYLNDDIEMVPLELKGRAERSAEPFSDSMEDMVDDLYRQIKNRISDNEYAILGHSMGSIVTYELAHKIQLSKYKKPVHLFFSGSYPPEFCGYFKPIWNTTSEDFKVEIMSLGGTSIDIFENEYLSSIFVPILRADYKVLEEYKCEEYKNKLVCDISVFYGLEDERTNNKILYKWQDYSSKKTEFYSFNGNHFFINNCKKEVVKTINIILIDEEIS